MGYGASQRERQGETGCVPYGGVAPVVAGWAMVPVSRRGRARQGVCYVAVGGRLAGRGGEFETTYLDSAIDNCPCRRRRCREGEGRREDEGGGGRGTRPQPHQHPSLINRQSPR